MLYTLNLHTVLCKLYLKKAEKKKKNQNPNKQKTLSILQMGKLILREGK